MRQLQKVLSVVLLVSAVWMSPAYAAAGWFKCEVILAGMSDSNKIQIRVTDLAADPAFDSMDFFSTSENMKAFLAIGLTAMSNDMPVHIYADPDLSLPTFFRIYLAKE